MAVKTTAKKRTKHTALPVVLLVAALVLGGALGYFLLAPMLPGATGAAPQVALEAPIRAMALDVTPFATAGANEDELNAYIDKMTAFAVEYGFNAVTVPVVTENGTLYRDSKLAAMPGLTTKDGFFHKYDALSQVCSMAGAKGLAVYAVLDDALVKTTDEDMMKSLQRMTSKHALNGLLVQTAGNADAQLYADYTAFAGTGEPPAQSTPVLYLTANDAAAVQTLYVAAQAEDYPGAVVANYTALAENTASYGVLLSTLNVEAGKPTLLAYSAQQTLAVSYPAEGDTLSSATVYVMGTSDAAGPLAVNGTEVTTRAENGVWGTAVALTEGENTLTVTNGSSTQTVKVTYKKPQSGTSKTPTYKTSTLEEGAVKVAGWISSTLSDPHNAGSITGTARQGAIAGVAGQTTNNGEVVAYLLSTGDWVSAANVTWLDEVPEMKFTGATAVETPNGENISFTGSGTPLVNSTVQDNTLTLVFADTTLEEGFAIEGSAMVAGCATDVTEDGLARMVLTFNETLWGYSIEYENDSVVLQLKKAPAQSTEFAKPLAGVTVLLDAGHGGTDNGAMGVAGANGPMEKDANLAVANAAKYRLEQLGATVYMTREDDSFPSLENRLQMADTIDPDFFIAIHHNSSEYVKDLSDSQGVECYYFFNNESATLSAALVKNMSTLLGRTDRGSHGGYYYYVTRTTICPAVLLECGFMPSPAEYANITNDTEILKAGNAIAQGVLDATPKANGETTVTVDDPADTTAQVDPDSAVEDEQLTDSIQHPLG